VSRAGRIRFLAILFGVVLSVATNGVRAQEPSPVSGSLRLGAWSSTRTLDDRQGAATLIWWAKGSASLGQRAAVYAEGWAGYQDLGHRAATSGMLRETYLDLSLGPLDIRAGRQIIVWGRADGINPTDNISPRDFTLLVADDDDQRFGLGAVKASLYAGSVSFTGLWLPEPAMHVVPIPGLSPAFTAREARPAWPQALAKERRASSRRDWRWTGRCRTSMVSIVCRIWPSISPGSPAACCCAIRGSVCSGATSPPWWVALV